MTSIYRFTPTDVKTSVASREQIDGPVEGEIMSGNSAGRHTGAIAAPRFIDIGRPTLSSSFPRSSLLETKGALQNALSLTNCPAHWDRDGWYSRRSANEQTIVRRAGWGHRPRAHHRPGSHLSPRCLRPDRRTGHGLQGLFFIPASGCCSSSRCEDHRRGACSPR